MAYQETVRVCITLPADLLKVIDDMAKAVYFYRSEVIKIALLDYISAKNLQEAKQLEVINELNRKRVLDEYLLSKTLKQML